MFSVIKRSWGSCSCYTAKARLRDTDSSRTSQRGFSVLFSSLPLKPVCCHYPLSRWLGGHSRRKGWSSIFFYPSYYIPQSSYDSQGTHYLSHVSIFSSLPFYPRNKLICLLCHNSINPNKQITNLKQSNLQGQESSEVFSLSREIFI